jgi:hypothetical protein
MIVHEINLESLAILETKNNPPVTGHRDAPNAIKIACKTMQAPAWKETNIGRLGGLL